MIRPVAAAAHPDARSRRHRTTPTPTGKRVTLTERDWLWLQKIHEHGPLASSFLLAFAKHLGRSEKRATERLTDLFHENDTVHHGTYLTRPPQQFATIDSRYNQLVYDLAPAGKRALKGRGLWHETNAARSGPWLHNFMVSSITASIEIGARERDDLEYIPEHRILERAQTTLSYPVTIIDPTTKKSLTKDLKPDALFGLEYKTKEGSRYRFFVVEADRGTEPATTSNFSRKSALRSLLQYREYVEGGLYKYHLKLTAPLLVLNVCGCPERTDCVMRLAESEICNAYMLHQSWDEFGAPWRPPVSNARLLFGEWRRAAKPPIRIDGP